MERGAVGVRVGDVAVQPAVVAGALGAAPRGVRPAVGDRHAEVEALGWRTEQQNRRKNELERAVQTIFDRSVLKTIS